MSSSTKIDNRKMNLLILRKGPTQRLEHTLSAEKMYLINFTERTKKIICLMAPKLSNLNQTILKFFDIHYA